MENSHNVPALLGLFVLWTGYLFIF